MSQLYCGASRRDITPPAELLPRLVGLKQRRFAGVLDEIYVRAAVFTAGQDSLLFLGFDMTTAPCAKEILGKLTEATGIPEDHIFFYGIHTHAVPFNAIDMEERERQSEDTRIASEAYTQSSRRIVRRALSRDRSYPRRRVCQRRSAGEQRRTHAARPGTRLRRGQRSVSP